jgi:hypothetical protein
MSGGAEDGRGIEKRRLPRLEECDKVTVTVLSSPNAPQIEHKKFHCWTQDLSEGGLKFKAHSYVPIGTTVNVEVLFLSDSVVFRHLGRVVWEREVNEEGLLVSELGVKFTKIIGGEDQLESWKEAIKSKLEL